VQSPSWDSLATRLGRPLPAEYLELQRHYPFDPESMAAELWLFPDPEQVERLTRTYQADGWDGQPWPPDWLVIGSDGGEELYVLDVGTQPATVRALELETGRIKVLAPSLAAWVTQLERELEEIAADLPGPGSASRARPWWHFWR
jgi:hypothetical protein